MIATFEVPGALDGERVDRALALLTERSRSEIGALIKGGRVHVGDREIASAHAKVMPGQTITIDLPDEPIGTPMVPEVRPEVPFAVVYDDRDVIVVDKPAGVVVHPGAGHTHDTLVSGLLARYPDLAALAVGETVDRPGIVHRLDKDTSGLLVVARNAAALDALGAQLADRSMGRTYLALAKGAVDSEEGAIEAPIGRSLRDPKKMAVRAEGRYAKTTYRVLNRYVEPDPFTYLECRLSTGRTHQIRVHLSAIGHPVVGDRQYGGTVRKLGLYRPFLHAAEIRFLHPTSSEPMTFTSALPPELTALFAQLVEKPAS